MDSVKHANPSFVKQVLNHDKIREYLQFPLWAIHGPLSAILDTIPFDINSYVVGNDSYRHPAVFHSNLVEMYITYSDEHVAVISSNEERKNDSK